MKKSALIVLSILAYSSVFAQGAIRPLAQEYVTVASSPDSKNMPVYSPAILRLSTGRLIASYTESRKKEAQDQQDYQVFKTSDDGGTTWTERGTSTTALQGRLFEANGIIYYIATGAGMPSCKSSDNGNTWSNTFYLTSKNQSWQQTAANVWFANGNVYLEQELKAWNINAWGAAVKAPVLMRGKVTDDLSLSRNWTFSNPLVFADIIPCYKENNPKIDYTGIPFYPQTYPNRNTLAAGRSFSPMGWAEANVVQIYDPKHYWYDATGSTFYIFLRSLTGLTNFAGLCKAVENKDGSISTSLVSAPSGKKMLFVNLPGGHNRFHILYDSATKTYWLLSNQSTDSMTRPELLDSDRHDLAYGERNRLVLHFSKNMIDWCLAGVVAIGETQKEARSYACMDFDGNDIVILSRSGSKNAYSAHETDLITFHRIQNFRNLIY